MATYSANIIIDSGSDFVQTFYLEDTVSNSSLNLNNYTATASLKKSPVSLKKSADFSVSFPNASEGQLRISLASTITSTLKPGRYSYDILLTSGSIKVRAVEGSAIVTAGVTTT